MGQLWLATLSLEDSKVDDEGNSRPREDDPFFLLVKRIEDGMIRRPVRDLLAKLLDPEADSLNKSYNSHERETAQEGMNWLTAYEANPRYNLALFALGSAAPRDKIPIRLEETLEGQLDRIALHKRGVDDAGKPTQYDQFDLIMDQVGPGACHARG
ncbi:MAG: hypothetical protein V1735_04785 [Nanoarchaeota archaeon]